jgi:hypothetical protein
MAAHDPSEREVDARTHSLSLAQAEGCVRSYDVVMARASLSFVHQCSWCTLARCYKPRAQARKCVCLFVCLYVSVCECVLGCGQAACLPYSAQDPLIKDSWVFHIEVVARVRHLGDVCACGHGRLHRQRRVYIHPIMAAVYGLHTHTYMRQTQSLHRVSFCLRVPDFSQVTDSLSLSLSQTH